MDGRASTGEEAATRFGQLQEGVFRDHPQIRIPEHLEPPCGADAIDGGDHRLVEFELLAVPRLGSVAEYGYQAIGERIVLARLDLPGITGSQCLGALGDLGDELLQIRPDAVDVLDAGEDRDERILVIPKTDPAIGELTEVFEVQ